MCIVAVCHQASSRYPLIVAANRDERHARRSTPAEWWDTPESILAGRDLEAGGAWFGVTRNGRVAAVTNIFESGAKPGARSRGALVTDFLQGHEPPAGYARRVEAAGADFGPFNLVVGDAHELAWVSNRDRIAVLEPGIHVFSNNQPGDQWAKKSRLAEALQQDAERKDLVDALFQTLTGREARGSLDQASDSLFIVGDTFGTRCATVLTIDRDGTACFAEHRFAAGGVATGRSMHSFSIES